ncbi:MAG: cyclase [Candidatus Doudnabacteria bacterium CG10_big_fil_rev_8_21_14_0_10_41_10]|uniref:Kynurenine formamidase n=1 Tax=Candidatus Doudnabacteria bacterium CG10_big_fil_rev_8_21_14_0_10_41_10 TaxID=1974551 RepID=A0A2H0VGS6_9BACT|nr:MAG: cyclase [Candidatus Doudnabacteria bacterium CG10_big_fil_rev_8_21_14_0_10_41_10]
MKYYDISLELSEKTIVWPGDGKFKRVESKGSAITSRMDIATHFGTHIDAPKHFLFNRPGIDSIPVNKLIGKCLVIEVRSVSPSLPKKGLGGVQKESLIRPKDFAHVNIKARDKILFKTRNSQLLKKKTFVDNYVSLALDAAKYLASKKIDLVGIDYFGIEAKSAPGHPVHKTLLAKGIVIIEAVDLSRIKPGKYNIAALPLKIKASDGSPARVILWK